jgi:drug/metabolite transporter (DMT)-like permease
MSVLNDYFMQGSMLLGEVIGLVDFVLALFCFGGVIFVSRPEFLFGATTSTNLHATSPYAVWAGLAAAFCQAAAYVAIRKLKSVNYMVVIHYFMLTCSIGSALWVMVLDEV